MAEVLWQIFLLELLCQNLCVTIFVSDVLCHVFVCIFVRVLPEFCQNFVCLSEFCQNFVCLSEFCQNFCVRIHLVLVLKGFDAPELVRFLSEFCQNFPKTSPKRPQNDPKVTLGSFSGRFQVVFGSFLGRFWVVFGLLWGCFWVVFGSCFHHLSWVFFHGVSYERG